MKRETIKAITEAAKNAHTFTAQRQTERVGLAIGALTRAQSSVGAERWSHVLRAVGYLVNFLEHG